MADAPVEIVAYDPTWPDRFAEQQVELSALLGPWLVGTVEHVGSTAVPGLPAKPVVDMLAPVRSLADARQAVGPLEGAGWLSWPDDPCRHWRLWFLRPRPETRTHHLHVIEHGHPQAEAMLLFRDALRSDAELRDDYSQLKGRLARQHRHNRNAYTNAKGEFIVHALRSLGFEPPAPDRLPD